MRQPPSGLLLLLLLLSGNVLAEQEEAPPPELLEFLGSWETAEGEWIDPLAFLDEAKSAQDEEREQDD